MPFIFKMLKAGTAAVGTSPLYTVPVNTQTLVSNLRFHNSGAVAVSFDIAVKSTSGSSPQTVISGISVPASGQAIFNSEMTLSAGNVVEVTASLAGVDYLLSGVERV